MRKRRSSTKNKTPYRTILRIFDYIQERLIKDYWEDPPHRIIYTLNDILMFQWFTEKNFPGIREQMRSSPLLKDRLHRAGQDHN